ncbi:MAG: hypothetical protein K2Y56_08405 [Methylobacterium sp.]|uniref:DUF6894 family protein n=1 Tax=Methylobacterium sp. TaxID=409 RepID=UPI0025F53FAF|nr:hypothetical protein [Methylobacterium sp.]MBX9931547.1 hypothetical protein [Methylobacterium sp.]
MPRYTIDTNDDELLVEGDDAEGLTDVEAARRAALSVLPDMAREKLPDGDRRTFCASVRDEEGRVVYKATLTLVGEWQTL